MRAEELLNCNFALARIRDLTHSEWCERRGAAEEDGMMSMASAARRVVQEAGDAGGLDEIPMGGAADRARARGDGPVSTRLSATVCHYCHGHGHVDSRLCETCAGIGLVPELRDSERRMRAAAARMRDLSSRIRCGL